MIKVLLLILSILPLTSFATPQDDKKQEENQYYWITGQRDTIPQWVFEKQGDGRYVGISDPCLDHLNGNNQALLRAWLLFMMDYNTEVNLLMEFYDKSNKIGVNDYVSTKLKQFVRITPTAPSTTIIRMGRVWTSLFGESFVEIFIIANHKHYREGDIVFSFNSGDTTHGEYSAQYDESSVIKTSVHSKLNIFQNGNKPQSTTFATQGTERDRITKCMINGKLVKHNERNRFWYANSFDNSYQNNQIVSKEPLNDGVWYGLHESMMKQIVNYDNYSFLIKSVTEVVNTQVLKLNRSVYCGNISISLNNYNIFNNQIIANWDIILKEPTR